MQKSFFFFFLVDHLDKPFDRDIWIWLGVDIATTCLFLFCCLVWLTAIRSNHPCSRGSARGGGAAGRIRTKGSPWRSENGLW